jgi:hypothetical protein
MYGKKIQHSSFSKLELTLLKYIFRHYKEKLNPRTLARTLDINHAHATKLCASLAEKSLLKKEELGNSIFYSFNYNNSLSIGFISFILSLEEKESSSDLAVLLHSLKGLEPYLSFGCIYGSSIHKKDYNDIDVLLVYDPKHRSSISKLKDNIRQSGLITKPIRYLEISTEDIKKNKDDPIFYSIISDCMVFSNPQNYAMAIRDASA